MRKLALFFISTFFFTNALAGISLKEKLLSETGKQTVQEIWSDGGRSWTTEDEIKYSGWLNTIDESLLEEWNIPTDCADAVLALRWIYAVKNGLALKFTNGKKSFDSVGYRGRPIQMLMDAMGQIVTRNLNHNGYAVELFDPLQMQSGMFATMGGHSFSIVFEKIEGIGIVPMTLESTVPVKVRKMARNDLSSIAKHSMKFYRFFSVENLGNRVEFIQNSEMTSEYPNFDSEVMVNFLRDCVGDSTTYHKPFLANFYNLLWMVTNNDPAYEEKYARARLIYSCDYNVAREGRQFPSYNEIQKRSETMACAKLQGRAQAVNIGYEACYSRPSKPSCAASPDGDYSTGSRDYKLVVQLEHLRQLRQLNQTLSPFQCSVDLTQGFSEERVKKLPSALKNVAIDPFAPDNSSMKLSLLNLGGLHEDEAGRYTYIPTSSDPRVSLSKRWNCDTALVDCFTNSK